MFSNIYRYEATPENMNFVTTFWDSPTTRIGPTPDDCFGDDTTAPKRLGLAAGVRRQFNPLTGDYESIPVYHQLLDYDPAGQRGVHMSVARYGGRSDMYGGRDPVNNAGISSRDRTYICCGLPLDHPGCFMDTYSATTADSVPYTYGLGKDFWKVLVDILSRRGLSADDQKRLFEKAVRNSLKRGTGWIDQSLYDDLHAKIQKLETVLTPLLVDSGFKVAKELGRPGANAQSVIQIIYSSLSTGGLKAIQDMFTLIAEYNRYRCNGKSVHDLPRSPSEWLAFVIQDLFRLTAEQEITEAIGTIPDAQLRISRSLIDALPKFGSVAAARGSPIDMFSPAVTKDVMQLDFVPPPAPAGPLAPGGGGGGGGAGIAPKKAAGGGGAAPPPPPSPGPPSPASIPGASPPSTPGASPPASPVPSPKVAPPPPSPKAPSLPKATPPPSSGSLSPPASPGLPKVPAIPDPFQQSLAKLAVDFERLRDAADPKLTPLVLDDSDEDRQRVRGLLSVVQKLNTKDVPYVVGGWLQVVEGRLTAMTELYSEVHNFLLAFADERIDRLRELVREKGIVESRLTPEQTDIIGWLNAGATAKDRVALRLDSISREYERLLDVIPRELSTPRDSTAFAGMVANFSSSGISTKAFQDLKEKVRSESGTFKDLITSLEKAPPKAAAPPAAPGKGKEEEEAAAAGGGSGGATPAPSPAPVLVVPGSETPTLPSEEEEDEVPVGVTSVKQAVAQKRATDLVKDKESVDAMIAKVDTDPLDQYPEDSQVLLGATKNLVDATDKFGGAIVAADAKIPVPVYEQLALAFDKTVADTNSVVKNVTDSNGILNPLRTKFIIDLAQDVSNIINALPPDIRIKRASEDFLLPKNEDPYVWPSNASSGVYGDVGRYLTQCLSTVLSMTSYADLMGQLKFRIEKFGKLIPTPNLTKKSVQDGLRDYNDAVRNIEQRDASRIFLLSPKGRDWLQRARDELKTLLPPGSPGDAGGLPPVPDFPEPGDLPGAGDGGGSSDAGGDEGGGSGASEGGDGATGGDAVVKTDPDAPMTVTRKRTGTLTADQRANLTLLKSVFNLLGITDYSRWASSSGVKIEDKYFPWKDDVTGPEFDFAKFNKNVLEFFLLNLRGPVEGGVGDDFSNKPRDNVAAVAFPRFTSSQEKFLFFENIGTQAGKSGRDPIHPPAEQIGLVKRKFVNGDAKWVLNTQWDFNAIETDDNNVLSFPSRTQDFLFLNVGRIWASFITIVLEMTDETPKLTPYRGDLEPVSTWSLTNYMMYDDVLLPARRIGLAVGRGAVWTTSRKFLREDVNVNAINSSMAIGELTQEEESTTTLIEAYNTIPEDVHIYPDGIDKADIRRADTMLKQIGDTLRHINEKQLYVRLNEDNEVISIDLEMTVQKNLIKPIMLCFQLVLLRLGQLKLAEQTGVALLKSDAIQFNEIASLGLAKFAKDVISVQSLIDIGVLVRSKAWEPSTDKVEEHLRTSAGFSTGVSGKRYMFIDRSKISIDEQLALLSRWGAFAELLSMILDNKGDPNDYAMRNLAAEVSRPWRKQFVAAEGAVFLTAEDLKSVIDSMDWSFGDEEPPKSAVIEQRDDLADIAEWGE